MNQRRRLAVVMTTSGAAISSSAVLMASQHHLSDASAGALIGLVSGCAIVGMIVLARGTKNCARG